jgi:glycolate oxidase
MINRVLLKEFNTILGQENVFTDPADLATYAYDAAVVKPVVPSLALRPTTDDALSRMVRLCNENRLPMTVRGAGTNLSGGTDIAKSSFLEKETGIATILYSKRIKSALDPNNILNPGKIFEG